MTEENKRYEGHGNNWHAMIDCGEKELYDIAWAANHDENGLVKTAGNFIGSIGYEPPVRALVLYHRDDKDENNIVDSLYPFLQVGNPIEIKISKIDEWSNKCEAVIWGSVDEVKISFFDTLYFLNKDKYKIGQSYLFNLAGIAHSFGKRTENLEFVVDEGPMKGEKCNTMKMTSYLPSHEYGGEFTFCHPFTSFDSKVEAFGTNLFHYPFYLMPGVGEKIIFSFPLYVSEKALKGYTPELNDPIEGTGWLQGYLIDSL